MQITLPDKSKKEFEAPISGTDIARNISHGLAKAAIAVVCNGVVIDLNRPIKSDCSIEILTFDDIRGKEVFWHSTAHIMASAVVKLYPDTKVTIGPAIDKGFYYDFDRDEPFTPEDLDIIEAEMQKIVKENYSFSRIDVSKKEAREKFEKEGENYKVEILDDLEDDEVSLYTHHEFVDLCRGPHIPSTGYIKAFKLTSVAGAYWRGSEQNRMLQRIYGISFPKKKMLDEYLEFLEEAKKRDHRVLGPKLDLFSISEEVGAGLVLWHPRGSKIRRKIEDFWYDEHYKNGYEIVYSPHIANLDLWKTSGHLDHYNENMYSPLKVESNEFQLRPMNCPFHIVIYKSQIRSYRDLPIRWAEMGTVYRYERSGVLHGLMRVRGFTQDDAHVFCSQEQMPAETLKVVDFSLHILRSFGFKNFKIYLSTLPEKHVGDLDRWEAATESLRQTLEDMKIDYEVDEGGGAFYGPKIDINLEDTLGRLWQCSTIQFDFNLPERFKLYYVGQDGKHHTPYMIHRALLGSLERFFGTLIEFYGGYFPLWLTPEQARIMPISEKYDDYAKKIESLLKEKGIRCSTDLRSEKIGWRIREAENAKIPYMIILGEKEKSENLISVREHIVGDKGQVQIDEFEQMVADKVQNKETFIPN
ncbi:MAG: threonine--tRNA ligase [candidate division Zixibacteria bacterium]|nr:threonine--tRNA ligase [candidate division Zixibacteria bacterium]